MIKILVIEDEALLREEIVEWLTLEGYATMSADNGLAGVELAQRHPPDLIVSDIMMPGLDGYGVLLNIHANWATTHIPFIFLTARAAHEDIRKGMNLGADDYITKPFSRLELLEAIRARLRKKAAQAQHHEQEIEQLRNALAQEHEQRLLKAKLVAMFSHDFRNPLTRILSSNSLLRDYGNRIEEKDRLALMNRIDASVRQLLQMLDDVLLIAQIENDKIDSKLEQVDVAQFFQQVVEEFQVIHSETHQILFENRYAGTLRGDVRLLRQIAANLISNAIKYSPQGSRINIAVGNENGNCALTVEDHGIGIPEEDKGHLFDAFKRGSNVGNVTGTGLGLAIVKQAADLHGASIRLESRVDAGTKVCVVFPVR